MVYDFAIEQPLTFLLIVAGIVAGVLILYYPYLVAKKRKHSKKDAIRVCAVFSIIFWPLWIAAVIWAYTEDNRELHG